LFATSTRRSRRVSKRDGNEMPVSVVAVGDADK
jgi:hypothetical protein